MANNPYVNKVQYGDQTLMDLTEDTVTPEDVAEGVTFHDRSGAQQTGTGNYYSPNDTAETDIVDADYVPFYDTSASGKRKTLWSNVKAKLKAYFDGIYGIKVGEPLLKNTVGWVGKNKLKITSETEEKTGITFTVYKDGNGNVLKVRANGTNTNSGNCDFSLRNNEPTRVTAEALGFKSNKPYKFSGCTGGSSSTYFMFFNGANENKFVCYDDEVEDSFASNDTYYPCIRIRQGQTVNNVDFYPMFRDALIIDSTFEPYHDKVDYLKVNREEMKDTIGWSCKNLAPCHIDTIKRLNSVGGTWSGNTLTSGNATFVFSVNNDGYVTEIDVSGSSESSTNIYLTDDLSISQALKLNGCPSGGDNQVYKLLLVNTSGSSLNLPEDWGNGADLGVVSSIFRIQLRLYSGAGTVSHLKFYPMLRDASIADSIYEPYHESVEDWYWKNNAEVGVHNVMPNDYFDGVYRQQNGITYTVNKDGSIHMSGTNSSGNLSLFTLFKHIQEGGFLKHGETYIFSIDPCGGDTGVRRRVPYLFVGRYDGTAHYDFGTDKNGNIINDSYSERYYTIDYETNSYYDIGIGMPGSASPAQSIDADVKVVIRKAGDTYKGFTPYSQSNIELTQKKVDWENNSILGAKNVFLDEIFKKAFSINISGTTASIGDDREITINCTTEYNSGAYFQRDTMRPFFSNSGLALDDNWILSFDIKSNIDCNILYGESPNRAENTLTANTWVSFSQLLGNTLNNIDHIVFYNRDNTGTKSPVLTVKNIMLRRSSDTDDNYQPPAMTNQQLTENVIDTIDRIFSGDPSSGINCNTIEKEIAWINGWASNTGVPTEFTQGHGILFTMPLNAKAALNRESIYTENVFQMLITAGKIIYSRTYNASTSTWGTWA